MLQRLMDWTPDIIRFMRDASLASGYYVDLAREVLPFLDVSGIVCDAGCGLGQLAMALAPECSRVVGADISPSAIASFRSDIESSGFRNIEALQTDLHNYTPGKKYSSMVFNSFGSIDEILAIRERCTDGPVVIIKRNYKSHRFSFTDIPIHTHNRDSAVERLEEMGIPYREFTYSHEFGQRFRTLDDAVLFFSIYSRDEDRSLINRENVMKALAETGDEEFPYYLRKNKESRILVI